MVVGSQPPGEWNVLIFGFIPIMFIWSVIEEIDRNRVHWVIQLQDASGVAIRDCTFQKEIA
jgi:hypothetical protein